MVGLPPLRTWLMADEQSVMSRHTRPAGHGGLSSGNTMGKYLLRSVGDPWAMASIRRMVAPAPPRIVVTVACSSRGVCRGRLVGTAKPEGHTGPSLAAASVRLTFRWGLRTASAGTASALLSPVGPSPFLSKITRALLGFGALLCDSPPPNGRRESSGSVGAGKRKKEVDGHADAPLVLRTVLQVM